MHIIGQASPDMWTGTKHSEALSTPETFSIIQHGHYTTFPAFNSFPEYLASISYRNPDSSKGGWAYSCGQDITMYEW